MMKAIVAFAAVLTLTACGVDGQVFEIDYVGKPILSGEFQWPKK